MGSLTIKLTFYFLAKIISVEVLQYKYTIKNTFSQGICKEKKQQDGGVNIQKNKRLILSLKKYRHTKCRS